MDIRKIKKMIELLEESGIAEIEIKEGEETLRIARVMPAQQWVQSRAPSAPPGSTTISNSRAGSTSAR